MNGADPILKERFFGLTGPQGNHGEDVKEEYWYLEAAPTASWLRALYRYPQRAFPYEQLVAENAKRGPLDPEYELRDTGIFAEDRFFDIEVAYAKVSPDDIIIRFTAKNCGPDPAPLWILPTLWFRNRWTWDPARPKASSLGTSSTALLTAQDESLGAWLLEGPTPGEILFTENETNNTLLFGTPDASPFTKDAFHRHLVGGEKGAVNPAKVGTKAAAVYHFNLAPGTSATLEMLLRSARATSRVDFRQVMATRSR